MVSAADRKSSPSRGLRRPWPRLPNGQRSRLLPGPRGGNQARSSRKRTGVVAQPKFWNAKGKSGESRVRHTVRTPASPSAARIRLTERNRPSQAQATAGETASRRRRRRANRGTSRGWHRPSPAPDRTRTRRRDKKTVFGSANATRSACTRTSATGLVGIHSGGRNGSSPAPPKSSGSSRTFRTNRIHSRGCQKRRTSPRTPFPPESAFPEWGPAVKSASRRPGASAPRRLSSGCRTRSRARPARAGLRKAAAPAAEGEMCHRGGHPDVDPHVPGENLVAEAAGGATVVREEARHVAELAAVHESDRVLDGVHPDDAEHRPEDLGAGDLSLGRQPVQHRRTHEEAVLETRNPGSPAVHHRPGVLPVHGLTDQLFDALAALVPDHRTHVHRLVEPGAHHPALGGGAHQVPEGFMGAAHGDRQRRGQTPLTRAPEGALGNRPDRRLDVGVFEHHHRVLGPALALDAFPVAGGLRVDGPGHRRRADETHRGDVRMLQQRGDRLPPAVDDLHHPRGESASVRSCVTRCIVSGVFSEGFMTTVLPQAERVGQKPERDHRGKLKGAITATTPTGWRIMNSSIPRAMSSSTRPCISEGIPQATSTFSMARRNSPRDSASVLPHSVVTTLEISRNLAQGGPSAGKSGCTRSPGGVSRHSRSASRALATARPTSSGPDSGIRNRSSPVAGLKTGRVAEANGVR